jgi:hypothetical protein
MVWGEVFSRFLEESPVAVIVGAVMERELALLPALLQRLLALAVQLTQRLHDLFIVAGERLEGVVRDAILQHTEI